LWVVQFGMDATRTPQVVLVSVNLVQVACSKVFATDP